MRANRQWVERKRLMRFLGWGEGNYLPRGRFPGSFVTSAFFSNSMKTSWLTIVLLVVAASRIQGQVSQSGPPASAGQGTIQAQDTPYVVVSKGANQQVWQKTTYETLPSGQMVPHIHQYTELATGLHYWNNGQWVDSEEEIGILPNGTAAATNGQHQIYFPGDIYEGVIELVTPDGKYLRARPLGLSYDDGTNTVLIAELTNSVGYLVGSNQVIYPDAFTGVEADLRYTYTKAGVEQDIILREQPPMPESFGLNPQTTRLQVLTEFFNPPQPNVKTSTVFTTAGKLTDQQLNFGVMQMVPGKAFLLGTNSPAVWVTKQWVLLDGRQFLVEEVPVTSVANELNTLPQPAVQTSLWTVPHFVSKTMVLPPQRLVRPTTNTMFLAKASAPSQGLVLDYVTMISQGGYTFQGDTTYYISGTVNMYSGLAIFEGGAVFKYAIVGTLFLNTSYIWQASAYRPIIFTSKHDNSVGETISGSSGNPNPGCFFGPALEFEGYPGTLAHFRIAYAKVGLYLLDDMTDPGMIVTDAQFVNCSTAIKDQMWGNGWSEVMVENSLFANVQISLNLLECSVAVENSTFANSQYLVNANSYPYNTSALSLTNCILANVTNLYNPNVPPTPFNGDYNGFYNSPTFGPHTFTNTFYPFQSVGAGNYYLTNGCNFTNVGTANIDATLLVDLQTKTTHPPILYSNVIIATNLTLSPQVPRDTNTAPDLGYHYDPLDYVFGGVDLYSNLTVTAGTAVGYYADYGNVYSSGQPYGISLNDGANLTSSGTAIFPSWIVRYNTVQEGGNGNWTATGYMGGIMFNGSGSSITPQLNGHFTKWASGPGGGGFFRDNWAYGVGSFSDCEFYGSAIGSYRPSLYFTNCLFARVFTAFWDQMDAASFTFQNCTFYEGALAMSRVSGQSPSFWTVRNSAFDGTVFGWGDNFQGNTNYTAFDYNAYNSANTNWQTYPYPYPPDYGTLEVVGPHDVIVTNGYNWQSSWLGNYYLLTGELGLQYGSRTYPVAYSYDYAGRMKTMTNWSNFSGGTGARVTTWNYDGYRGFLTNKTFPDSSKLGYVNTSANRLASRTWARGITTTYGYNNAGDLATVVYSDGTTPNVTNTYDRWGRLIQIGGASSTESLIYNDANELLSESYSGGVLNGLSVTNGYDADLRRTSLALNSQLSTFNSTAYGYDNASRLATVSDGTNNAAYSYLANSPLVGQITFKSNSVTRMTTTKSYDYLNRLTSISSVGGASSASPISFNYNYNNANQRVRSTLVDNSYWVYNYDALGQVISGCKYFYDHTPVAGQQFDYTFDTIGNRTQTQSGGDQNGGNQRSANYSANNLNQYTSRDVPAYVDVKGVSIATNTVTVNGQTAYRKWEYFRDELGVNNSSSALWVNIVVAATGQSSISGNVYVVETPEQFSYDADGNLTNDGRWSYTWDGENRLATMTVNMNVGPQYQLAFAYDSKGRRIQKIVSTNSVALYTNKFIYDGWNLLAVLSPSSQLLSSYTWGNDLSGSQQGAGGVGGLVEVSYYGASTTNCFAAYDGNGNVAALVNAADGTIAANYEYGPFGEVIRSTGPMAKLNPFRFSTKYDDDESDLLYYGYRYYKPSTGTWPNRDPIQERGGLNLYGFVGNDSIDRVDILGLMKYQDVERMIALMDQAVSGIKCCCSDDFLANAIITGKADGTKVSLTADLKILREKCPTGIVTYFWWDCFSAQQEAGYSWWHGDKEAWKQYGWSTGGATATGDHVGGKGSWFGFDPADSMDWAWRAIVVYVRCENGRMHARGKLSNTLDFTWITDANAWGNYPYTP
jgi:RHS repeat-associated protein